MTDKIVICIPVKLKNRLDIAGALLARYGTDYLFIDEIFKETATNEYCHISINPILDNNSEPSQKLQFKKQSKTSLFNLCNICGGQQEICLTSNTVGYKTCFTMARFTQVFLKLGGLAVNVESAEIAHQPDRWLANYNSQDIFDLYSLYVGLVEGENNYYSCGMHNFGKADVSLDLTEDMSLAIYVMNVFNYYRLTESPILQDGHTFQPDIESPRYRIQLIEDKEYEPDSIKHNSWGRWHLSRC